jgi:hypothetical protein
MIAESMPSLTQKVAFIEKVKSLFLPGPLASAANTE